MQGFMDFECREYCYEEDCGRGALSNVSHRLTIADKA